MIAIESKVHAKHKPDWSFRVGKSTFQTRDVPDRIAVIQKVFRKNSLKIIAAENFPAAPIRSIHSYHDYLKGVCANIKDANIQYLPDIFPGRSLQLKHSPTSPYWMGYFCSSAVTPILKHTYDAAKGSADAALTGAKLLASGRTREAYALCRPPGHHASPKMFGGYCYFNNAAVAANWLSKRGKVAILDIDYHHGDGTQAHFYDRSDVLTCSIHGEPAADFPYITGYKKEKGLGKGLGYNHNFPIPLQSNFTIYQKSLTRALRLIRNFQPKFLVIAAGYDTFAEDPVGNCRLKIRDYVKIGHAISALQLPTLMCQEGGYNLSALGESVYSFVDGFLNARNS